MPKYEDFKSEDHNKFLKDNNIVVFPGYWNPNHRIFFHLIKRAGCWLADGGSIDFNKDTMNHNNYSPECGFSVRLVKELDTTI